MCNHVELIEGLFASDDKAAYQCLKQLQAESACSNAVYSYFDRFAGMLKSPNSYIRTRGLLLIAANAQWDTEHKLDEIIDEYLAHILDNKPITARQCIKTLPCIAKHKPDLSPIICAALRKADPGRYKSSMQQLVYKDIIDALNAIL